MQKRGKTAAGTQRWLCVHCRRSHSLGHDTQQRGRLLDRFVAWLLGKQSQEELAVPARTWRQQIQWCWEVVPKPDQMSEVHPVIILDGIRVGSLVCLIARTPRAVLAWRWVGWESSTTWGMLLAAIPAPAVVVCDGQKGILLALAQHWPETRIQRCLFHVWQNIRAKLTLNPQTAAGQELLQLTRDLWSVQTKEQALLWQHRLDAWEQEYGDFIRERTYVTSPQPHRRHWWYTHRGVWSAFRQLKKLVTADQLFVYLDAAPATGPIPRTTNYVEGGVNSPLRSQLKLHRGLNQLHQQRLVEWYLYTRTTNPKPPRNCL